MRVVFRGLSDKDPSAIAPRYDPYIPRNGGALVHEAGRNDDIR